jgi:membrane associated rhomboid family serine protease
MDSAIDYSKHTEAELVEMFERLDPRYAPEECERLGTRLSELGYIVTQGETGPGSVQPSPTKLQALIGSSRPFECEVHFGDGTGPASYLQPAHNSLGFVGPGKLWIDGINVYLTGESRPRQSILPWQSPYQVQIPTRRIVNVESLGRLVRFEYSSEEADLEAITLQVVDDSVAAALIANLPKAKTRNFRPQLTANVEFEARLIARSPKAPVTYGLVAINALIFIAMLFAGAGGFHPVGKVQIAWGSNYGPYTTHGEWWRVFTSLFIHFGLLHVWVNMVALLLFGPLVERLYGSVIYLLLYLAAGTLGSLAAVAWHPTVNSAGASGAIFGICGALLAAQLRAGDRFPPDISRPTRNSTLLFLGWALYSSFSHPGIDYAAHIGGLASGFILGLIVARPE